MSVIRFLLLMLCSAVVLADDIIVEWSDPGVVADGFIITHNVNGVQLADVTIGDGNTREHLYVDPDLGIHFFTIRAFIGEVESLSTPSNGVLLTNEITLTIRVQ